MSSKKRVYTYVCVCVCEGNQKCGRERGWRNLVQWRGRYIPIGIDVWFRGVGRSRSVIYFITSDRELAGNLPM